MEDKILTSEYLRKENCYWFHKVGGRRPGALWFFAIAVVVLVLSVFIFEPCALCGFSNHS